MTQSLRRLAVSEWGEGMEIVGIKPDTHELGMVIWRHIKEIRGV